MNSTTSSLSIYLPHLQLQIMRSLLTPVYIIGILSNLANILVFSQHSLRSHICSWYFIGASIGQLVYLNFGCLTRVIWSWTQYDLTLISLPFCKSRIYFVLNGLTISRYFFCLISIDRWVITSKNTNIRRLSSRKVAPWLIIGGASLFFLLNIPFSIDYAIDKTTGCGRKKPVHALFYAVYNTAISLLPLCILCIFSFLIIFNIQQTKHQISPKALTTSQKDRSHQRHHHHHHKKDIQFIKLALVQVAGYTLFNTLHAYNAIHDVVTRNNQKSANQQAIDEFLYGLGLNLHYAYTGVCFLNVVNH